MRKVTLQSLVIFWIGASAASGQGPGNESQPADLQDFVEATLRPVERPGIPGSKHYDLELHLRNKSNRAIEFWDPDEGSAEAQHFWEFDIRLDDGEKLHLFMAYSFGGLHRVKLKPGESYTHQFQPSSYVIPAVRDGRKPVPATIVLRHRVTRQADISRGGTGEEKFSSAPLKVDLRDYFLVR
jgi:hypothetical protein